MGTRVKGSHEGAGWHIIAHRGTGWERERSTGARGGVVRSSAVERFAAWECEAAEVRNSLTHPKHVP